MIVKTRVEAEAATMPDLLRDLDEIKEMFRPLEALEIDDEHYERVSENGRPAHYKARLVLIQKEQAHA
jgi:hypothetical protein